MKWVLIWIAVTGSGSISSGSAEFASSKGCEAGRKALQNTVNEIAMESNSQATRLVRSRCLDDQGAN